MYGQVRAVQTFSGVSMRWRCPNHPVASTGQGSSASFRPPTKHTSGRSQDSSGQAKFGGGNQTAPSKHSFRTLYRRCRRDRRLHAAAIMAAALRPLVRRHAVLPPSSMLSSLFPAPYSKVRWFRCLISLGPSPRLDALTSLPSPGRRRQTPSRVPRAPAASPSEGGYSKEGSSNSKGNNLPSQLEKKRVPTSQIHRNCWSLSRARRG